MTLGEPVVFYLKYMAEMNRLCFPEDHGGEPDLTDLKNADKVKDMARIVGDLACERVADFLELCAKGIEEHVTRSGIGAFERKKTRAYMKKHWEWGARINVASVPGGWFWCGVFVSAPPEIHVTLAKGVAGLVVPYIWSKGGRKGADAIWAILDGVADSRAGEGVLEGGGSVALARIPIKADPPESFNVDRDPLVAEAVGTVARIGLNQAEDIARFAAVLNEPDED